MSTPFFTWSLLSGVPTFCEEEAGVLFDDGTTKAAKSLKLSISPSGIPHTLLIIPVICSKRSFFLCAPLKSINLLFWLRSVTIAFKLCFNSLKALVFPVKPSRDNLLNTLPSSSKSFPFHFAKVAKIVVCGFLGSACEKKLITSFVSSSSVFSDTSTCFHSVES